MDRAKNEQTIDDLGYLGDEVKAAVQAIVNNPPPYSTTDLMEMVHWIEFCRALKERDFTSGDQFVLNGISFIVEKG